jgi:alpha-tubulin suppressor-like RCC1 family protein
MKNMLTRNPSVTPSHSVRIGSMVTLLAAAGAVQTAHAGGVVRAWGDNYFGQSTVPTDLGACTAVAGGTYHSLAVRKDGGVRAWGDNTYGQSTVPTDLGACTAVAGGDRHSLAVRKDGGVRAWGDNTFGQSNVPTDLGACTAVAGGFRHSLALRLDGGVRAWGYNDQGQCDVPTDLGACTAVAAGGFHSLALTDALDSNHNGILDSVEIAALTAQLNCGDLDGDGEVNGADLGKVLIGWGQCQ